MNKFHNLKQQGFTLVEIGIVLAVIGLLIGGVLRGQELINSARARNIIDQKASIQTAMIAFTNRYKAMPGDLTAAQQLFIGSNTVASSSGGGNGIIALTNVAGTNESVLFFQNLAATSFLTCTACMAVLSNGLSTSENSPSNVMGTYLQFGTVAATTAGTTNWLDRSVPALPGRNILSTGSQISADILHEVDIKTDDGAPHTGLFRQSALGEANSSQLCAPAAGPVNSWVTGGTNNCAAAWFF